MDIRFQPGHPVSINLLSTREIVEGVIEKFEGHQALINVPRSLAPGTPVRIDLYDSMLLGEVSLCHQPPTPAVVVNVEIRDAIPLMPDLGRLVSAVIERCEESRTIMRAAIEPEHRRTAAVQGFDSGNSSRGQQKKVARYGAT